MSVHPGTFIIGSHSPSYEGTNPMARINLNNVYGRLNELTWDQLAFVGNRIQLLSAGFPGRWAGRQERFDAELARRGVVFVNGMVGTPDMFEPIR